jgi:hypothetical protein
MDLTGTEWAGVDWIHLAQDRVQWGDSYEHDKKPSGSIKDGEFTD